MTEPASSAAGIALAAVTIRLSGSIFGIEYDALLIGFAGGVIALSFLPQMTWAKVATTVTSSTLVAGVIAPIASAAAVHYFPWLSGIGEGLRTAAALILGIGSQFIIPLGIKWLREKSGVTP